MELGIGLMELGIGLRNNNARRTVLARVSGLVNVISPLFKAKPEIKVKNIQSQWDE